MWTEESVRALIADNPITNGMISVRDYVGGEGQAIRIELRVPRRNRLETSEQTANMYMFILDALRREPRYTDVFPYVDEIRIYCYERRNERNMAVQDEVLAEAPSLTEQVYRTRPLRTVPEGQHFTFTVDNGLQPVEDPIFDDDDDNSSDDFIDEEDE